MGENEGKRKWPEGMERGQRRRASTQGEKRETNEGGRPAKSQQRRLLLERGGLKQRVLSMQLRHHQLGAVASVPRLQLQHLPQARTLRLLQLELLLCALCLRLLRPQPNITDRRMRPRGACMRVHGGVCVAVCSMQLERMSSRSLSDALAVCLLLPLALYPCYCLSF